jgi:hypothetical protein
VQTRTPALVTAGLLPLTLALVLSACGAPVEEAVDTAAEETPEESGGGATDLLSGLGESTEDITNYTLDLSLTMDDPELGETETNITYEVMDEPEAAQVTIVVPELGESLRELAVLGGADPELTAEELGTSILIIPAEGESLVSNHNGLQPVETPWVRGGQDTGGMAPDEMFDVSALPEITGAVAEIKEIQETGAEEVSGVPTTVVEGTLTPEDLEAMGPERRDSVSELTNGMTGTIDVALWIADDGFPMRMDFQDDQADVSIVFSHVGETSFEMPAEDEITDL